MTVLEQIGDDIWIANGDIVNFYGFPYSTRCVVVQLANGTLWVWSPIALTDSLGTEIDALGRPAHLVSPNKLHHLYLQDWKTAYPDALLWGPLSTIKKRGDLIFETVLEDTCPTEWQGAFEQTWFRGSKFLDEIIFFHAASRTVIIADMSENFGEKFLQEHWSSWKRGIARLWGIVDGKGYAPLELRLTSFARPAMVRSRDKILGWNPRQVVMAHGEWQNHDGRNYLLKAFEWIG